MFYASEFVIQVDNDRKFVQHGYIVQHKDESVRKDSTDSGAFAAIAQVTIK